MPDKRDMHQAKSHRSNKHKDQAAHAKTRGVASVPNGANRAANADTVPMTMPTGKKNKSKH